MRASFPGPCTTLCVLWRAVFLFRTPISASISRSSAECAGPVINPLTGIPCGLAHWNRMTSSDSSANRSNAEDLYSEAVEAWDSCRQPDLVDRTLQFYTELYLQDGILAKVDRASMMHGLEARSPFLDLEVADFARRLPHCLKIRAGTTKYLLKKALEPLLPLDIIYRKRRALALLSGRGSAWGVWSRGATESFSRKSFPLIAQAVPTNVSISGANCATVSGWQGWAQRTLRGEDPRSL